MNGLSGRVLLHISNLNSSMLYIINVKANATGTGDGTSWANASGDLQAMINALGVQQVWVAEGHYYPNFDGVFAEGQEIYLRIIF